MKAIKRIFWTDYKRTQQRATEIHKARMKAKRERGVKAFLPYEDNILREYWPAEGDGVGRRMDRPLHAINARAKELGLERLPERRPPWVSPSVVPVLCAFLAERWA
jgi:hypothetical protein